MQNKNIKFWFPASVALIAVFITDLLIPLGIAVGVLYVATLFYVSKAPVKTIIFFAVLSIVLVMSKLLLYLNDQPGIAVYLNRGISVFAIIVVSIFAVQQRKLQEDADRERELHMRTLRRKNEKLETYRHSLNLHLLVTVIDKDGLIVYVNKPFSRISKYAESELKGRSFLSLGKLTDSEKIEIHDAINSGQTWRGELQSHAKDGSVFWCDTVLFPARDQHGNIQEFFSIGMPITDRKILEQEREMSIHAFETILWKVSHKLRAPIATCQGITVLLEMKHAAGPGMDELEKAAMQNRRHCTKELEEFTREIISIIESKGIESKSEPD